MLRSVVSWRALGLGLLSWFIPFAASFMFFDRTGTLAIPQPLFKSIMVVVGGGVGVGLLVLAFRRVPPTHAKGLALGLSWMAINLALDLIVLLPMMHASARDYFYDIGLRYLLLPFMAMGMGAVAERAAPAPRSP